ncbi:pectinesterase family protein [Massilia sp. IC2-476]|uniref:pectinesterase family protein n=1 Tax=Massilia sp. IC2-476 TaxID=2887199 RepID=UPI001D106685|nr:pectinesterase family protein [Massilia sp. IC2-476]MCC2971409.1 pectinesterase family protein [Massilia sp. IC2-476]
MKHPGFKASVCAAALLAAVFGLPASAATTTTDPARQVAPPDGWASQAGGTNGGAAATTDNIYTVTKRSELLAALANGADNPKIIKLVGTIDMTEGKPYTSTADQSARGSIRLRSNTTLIGADANAGIINGTVLVSNVSQVIIRNLKIVAPCDVEPVWDPTDGSTGNWNSAFDAIGVSGSHHVWVDHVTFTDVPLTDNFLPIENGKKKQCHDGALDITNASDYVTVSYNVFGQHDKNTLVGGSDSATADEGKLRVTFSNNVYRDIVQRAPRVRFGQVHVFNNYFVGSKTASPYAHSVSVAAGKAAKILSANNVFEIAGAQRCDQVVTNMSSTNPGFFKDAGSLLNGAPLGACSVSNDVTWTPPYAFTPRPAALVKSNALTQAGAGKIGTAISGTGKVTIDQSPTLVCPATGLYFCDDFQDGSSAKWDLLPVTGPNGSFSVKSEVVGGDNKVLQYTAASTGGVLALVKPGAFGGVPSGDYYVEARIRPMTNGTTGNKLLYLVTRYVNASNWYGAGLNVQSSTASTQVEIAKMLNNSLSRPRQVRTPIEMDAAFYTVRFEMIGSTLTVYLDGRNLGSVTDTAFTQRGLIGLYTANKTFMIDDVRVGDPRMKPVQLNIDPAGQAYSAEVGDAPYQVKVTAITSDNQPDSFSATSSNPAVVAVTTDGNTVSLNAVGAGRADIVFRSASEPAITRTITATIAPQFVQPTQTYAMQGASFPAPLEASAHVDTSLKLVFDKPPTLGTSGSIRIFRKLDDALVDVIRVRDETDAIGYEGQALVRKVNTAPIKIVGNTVTIKPHSNRLAYGTEYYVAIADGVFTNTSLGGTPFVGLGKAAGWTFSTKAGTPTGSTLTVDDDGEADFRTVQGALNHAMQRFAKADPVTINIRNGRYEELLYLNGKDNLSIKGESRDGVMISYTNNETLNPGTGSSQSGSAAGSPSGGRAVMLVEASDMLSLDTLSLKNTTIRSSSISGQAETIYFNSDGRLVAKNASFYSEQDTLNLKGWSWFYRTLVEGNVDFIWGSSRAALFEESEIRSVGDSANASSGGYVLQARVPAAADIGYVFLNSALTHGPGPGPLRGDVPNGATYLARSPGGTATWDNIAFINTRMDTHVAPSGWAGQGVNGQPAPNPTVARADAGWREYGTTDMAGNPLNLAARVGGYILSETDVANRFATRAKVFAGYGNGAGWNPQP